LIFFVFGALAVTSCTEATDTVATPRVTNGFHPVGSAGHRTGGLDFCRFGCPTDMYGYDEVEKLSESK